MPKGNSYSDVEITERVAARNWITVTKVRDFLRHYKGMQFHPSWIFLEFPGDNCTGQARVTYFTKVLDKIDIRNKLVWVHPDSNEPDDISVAIEEFPIRDWSLVRAVGKLTEQFNGNF